MEAVVAPVVARGVRLEESRWRRDKTSTDKTGERRESAWIGGAVRWCRDYPAVRVSQISANSGGAETGLKAMPHDMVDDGF